MHAQEALREADGYGGYGGAEAQGHGLAGARGRHDEEAVELARHPDVAARTQAGALRGAPWAVCACACVCVCVCVCVRVWVSCVRVCVRGRKGLMGCLYVATCAAAHPRPRCNVVSASIG